MEKKFELEDEKVIENNCQEKDSSEEQIKELDIEELETEEMEIEDDTELEEDLEEELEEEPEEERTQEEILEEQQEQFVEALERADVEEINEIYEQMHPIDLAEDMEDWDDELLGQLCSISDDETLAELIQEAEEDLQVEMTNYLDNSRLLRIFSYMQKDDIVDILGNLRINRRKQLIDLMRGDEKKIITELLGYDEESAGGIMTTAYIALNEKLTIAEAIRKIKEIGPKTELIETIFILNNQKQLIGKADLRDILVAQDHDTLSSITNEQIIYVEPETDQEEVSLLVSKYDLNAIPVVNKKKVLLGIITVDDVIDVILEEHTEDMLQLAGVSKEETIDSTIFQSVRRRLPWLCVNLITAFLGSFAIKTFESVIAQVVALSATMTIVTGLSGNSGNQTLSVIIRSLALGEVELKGSWKLVLKQAMIGLVDGIFMGLGTGFIVYLIYGNFYLGLIIFAAMICNMMIAGLSGALIPLVLKTLKQDPALASSIFLTGVTDVLGFFIFLSLAKIFLQALL